MKNKGFTWAEQARLVGQAVRPDYLQHFLFYHSPFAAGLQVQTIWSPDSLDCVKAMFQNDFWDERPRLLFAVCPGPN